MLVKSTVRKQPQWNMVINMGMELDRYTNHNNIKYFPIHIWSVLY